MTTRNAVPKRLKTGQRVTIGTIYRWAVIHPNGRGSLWVDRTIAREHANQFLGAQVVRLNPITGVVSK